MAHSIELLFDDDTEATIRRLWDDLAAADIPCRIPPGRPHVTVAVADRIDPAVDDVLRPLIHRLPLRCSIGAPVLFGRTNVVFTRLVVPSAELLALHAEVHRLAAAHLNPSPMPNSLPGQWTAHVTLARRIDAGYLGPALRLTAEPAQLGGHFAGLRRWDGDARTEHPL
ncbi:hypothetical protein A5647_12210 [Mycobacterium sp. 1100029.7]|nr:hypothetical protein A5647_12210 [Mycobacterium sp. 1100029.7]